MLNRSHAQIIQAGDGKSSGVAAFARQIGVPRNRVYPMVRSDSIPAPYWKAVVEAKLSTFTELASAAEKRRPEASSQEGCAA